MAKIITKPSMFSVLVRTTIISQSITSVGIVLCELIGRIEADPDIMPRTNAFGVDQDKFKAKFAGDCPSTFLDVAFQCAHHKSKVLIMLAEPASYIIATSEL